MSVLFHVIRWKNLTSYGSSFTEIRLDTHPLTLISGSNGAGKSTLIEAIFFALFGRPHRNINKAELINSINRKDLLVELEYSATGSKWLIRRGLKPTVFEIWRDDRLVPQEAASRDYQEIIDESLGMTHRSLSQVCTLGSASYIPFMRLPAAARREFVEDMLDVRVFSVMAKRLKDKSDECRDRLKEVENNLRHAERLLEVLRRHASEAKKDREAEIQRTQEQIETEYEALIAVREEKKHLLTFIQSVDGLRDREKNLVREQDGISGLLAVAKSELAQIKQNARRLAEYDVCLLCRQSINETTRESNIASLFDEAQEQEQKIKELENRWNVSQFSRNEITKQYEEASRVRQEIAVKEAVEQNLVVRIERLHADATEASSNHSSEGDIEATEREITTLQAELGDLLKRRTTIEVVAGLLKDDAIKAAVVRQYIPTINRIVNQYLAELDLFVYFELDESFTEHIKSRFRDEFSYESFSEGEKMRIDLALLLAWRDLAKMRNKASTNLLIMDEVLDSSLDVAGADDFMKVIKHAAEGTNAFVISHRGDQLQDKFQASISVIKQGNYSRRIE